MLTPRRGGGPPAESKDSLVSAFEQHERSSLNTHKRPYQRLHFAESDDTSGFFPQLGTFHNRERYRLLFGTLKPMAPWLREFLERRGVACISCGASTRAEYPLCLVRLTWYLQQARVDVLHTHLFEPSVIGLAAGVLARTPVRVITRHYSNYHTRIGKKWHVRAERLCNRTSHAIVAVSKHTFEHLVNEEGTAPEKLHVILNGIEFSRAGVPDRDAVARFRREWSADEWHMLLCQPACTRKKAIRISSGALSRVRKRVAQPIVALVAGAGPFEAAYREEVRAVGCDDIVRFLGFRRDVLDLMAAADLVVLPSVAEAFGLVLAEALYLGTPVVANRVGGIPEIVDDGVDGVLVPPADSGALADAIVGLLTDGQERQRLAGAGREKVRGRFSFEQMTRAYERLYERLLPQVCRPFR